MFGVPERLANEENVPVVPTFVIVFPVLNEVPPISIPLFKSAAAVGPITTMAILALEIVFPYTFKPDAPPAVPVAVADVVGVVAECVLFE